MWAQCSLHLRQYNDALLINDTLRMMDAYRSLEEFYGTKFTTAIDGTDLFLAGLFRGMNAKVLLTYFPCLKEYFLFIGGLSLWCSFSDMRVMIVITFTQRIR